MPTTKVVLSVSERIDRFRDGRNQKWIIEKLKEYEIFLTEPQFSTKKKAGTFTNDEMDALVEILPGFTY
jgi:hypothetical protein